MIKDLVKTDVYYKILMNNTKHDAILNRISCLSNEKNHQ